MKSFFLTGLLAFAVAGILGYNVVYKGYQEKLHLVHTQLAQEQATRDLQRDVAERYRQIEQYRKRLAPEPDPSWLVNQAAALGQQAGLKFATIDRETPQGLSQYTRLAVTLQFSATYHQLGMFLDRVERTQYFFRVERLEVSKPKREGEVASVLLVLSTMYVRPVSAAAGGS